MRPQMETQPGVLATIESQKNVANGVPGLNGDAAIEGPIQVRGPKATPATDVPLAREILVNSDGQFVIGDNTTPVDELSPIISSIHTTAYTTDVTHTATYRLEAVTITACLMELAAPAAPGLLVVVNARNSTTVAAAVSFNGGFGSAALDIGAAVAKSGLLVLFSVMNGTEDGFEWAEVHRSGGWE
jgi:hypothetical protein